MHITIQKEALLKPLQMVLGVSDKKHTMSVLSCLLCEASEEEGFKITASDLETEIVCQVTQARIQQSGIAAIPARKFVDIVKSLPGNATVELKMESENRIALTSGKSRFILSTLDAENFPRMETDVCHQSFDIEQSTLLNIIKKVQFSMAQNDVRYFLNGMLWEIEDKTFRAVSTDGHRMSLAETELTHQTDKTQLIIPRKSVAELQKMIEPSHQLVHIEIGSHHFRLIEENTIFTSKLIDGRYPDYTRVLPKSNNKVLTADRNAFKLALTRTAILSNEKYRGVRFHIEKNQLKMSANNPEQEEAQDEIPVEYAELPMEIGFNVSYLLDVVNVIESDDIHLYFSDPKMSLLIKENNDYHCQFVIMPIRL